MHFSTGRQIFYVSGRIFYAFLTGTKACVTAADLVGSDENLHCFTLPLSSCDIKISVVSQCRSTAGFSWLFKLWTHSCLRFLLTDWQLASADCTVTWSLLTWNDTDWTCWLVADARVWKHKHKFETDSDSCNTVHRSYTAYKKYTVGYPWCVNDGQLHPQQPSHDDTMHKKWYLRDFKKLPNQSSIFRCRHRRSYLSQTQSINECTSRSNMPEEGAKGMFCSSTLQVK